MVTTSPVNDTDKQALDKRYERISWGLFLVMIGGLLVVPDSTIPESAWLVGAGLIMLGLNLARYLSGIKTSGFTIVLGVIALLSGVSDMAGVDLPILAILLILFGAHIVYRGLSEKEIV